MEQYNKIILENGITLVAERIPYIRSVSIAFWMNSGSRMEIDRKDCGISHFIEHMLFKGTKNRTARQIAEEFDSIGGHLDAFTSKEHTCLYAKVVNSHFKQALSILADLILNPLFHEEDIEKEKKVINEEINMYMDNPDEYIHDLFMKALWGKHPLGQPILGTSDAILTLHKKQIINFYETQYTPSNLIISVVSSMEFPEIVNEVNSYFSSFNKKRNSDIKITAPVLLSQQIVEYKNLEQVHLCIGSEGLPVAHADQYVLHILQGVLGGNMSSRLFQKIREEKALAYSIASFYNAYKDSGYWTIYAGTSTEKINVLVNNIISELENIRNYPISEEELNRSKQQIKNSFLLSMEDTVYRMLKLAKHEIYFGRYFSVEEILSDIDKVSSKDVKRLAGDILPSRNFTATFLGKIKESQLPEILIKK